MRILKEKKIIIYETKEKKRPFTDWFLSFKDMKTKDRINKRIDRLKLGHYGDYKSIDENIIELRLFFGSGYRIYIAEDRQEIIILLCAGDKSTQKKDILKAKECWREYNE